LDKALERVESRYLSNGGSVVPGGVGEMESGAYAITVSVCPLFFGRGTIVVNNDLFWCVLDRSRKFCW
jgi:hypothetical protein